MTIQGTPVQVSKSLRRIAALIQMSKNPKKEIIAARLNRIITGSAGEMKQVITRNYESVTPVVDDFIEALKMWVHTALTEMGWENEAAAQEAAARGDTEAEKFVKYVQIVNKQISLISDAMNGIRSQLEQLDNEAYDSV